MSGTASATVRQHEHGGYTFASHSVTSVASATTPVLLVGGAFQRMESWGRIEQYLAERRPVVSVDLPGWGSADPLPARYDTDFLVAALRHLLDDLGLKRIDTVAGSYGAMIGHRLAQTDPDRVDHLVIMGAMTTIPDESRAEVEHGLDLLRDKRMDEFARATVQLFMCQDPAVPIVHRVAIDRILTHRFSSITEDEADKYVESTRRLLARDHLAVDPMVRVPTLVVTGEHDTYTPPAISRRVAESCPGSTLAFITDSDHMAHLERPREAVDLWHTFFADESLSDLPYCRVEQTPSPTLT